MKDTLMNIKEYEILFDRCKITMNDSGNILFTPILEKEKGIIEKIINDNKLQNLDFENFQALYKQFLPLYRARKDLKQRKIEQFSSLTPQKVADLPIEQKVEYMEALFPINQNIGELTETCKKNEQNIKSCLFSMDFPQDFWESEIKSATRYADLISQQPDITEKMKNWQNTTLQEKKDTITKAAKVFNYVYGTNIQIDFFTNEQKKAKIKEQNFDENTHINAAYYKKGKLYFNEDRLQSSDNYFPISVLFHEGTHLRQDTQTFDNQLVNRILNCNTESVAVYEDMAKSKETNDYKDLYAMLPSEKHAHALQMHVENELMEKSGIEKDKTETNKEIKDIHNKAFSMAQIAQFHSRNKSKNV